MRTVKICTLTPSLLFVFFAAAMFASRAQAPATWHILIEPKFMKPEVSFPISGAERTVLVPGYLKEDEPVYFSKKEFEGLGVDFAKFMEQSLANATDRKVKAGFVRDKKKVIQYAALRSESPLMATAVLSPDFLKTFEVIFGKRPLVAVPNRFTVYIFPRLAGKYQEFAPQVIGDYKDSVWPVSLEVFEAGSGGLKAVGTYEAP